jgi:hypothetical protein
MAQNHLKFGSDVIENVMKFSREAESINSSGVLNGHALENFNQCVVEHGVGVISPSNRSIVVSMKKLDDAT